MGSLYTTVSDEDGLGFWVVRDGRKLVRHTTKKAANKMRVAMENAEANIDDAELARGSGESIEADTNVDATHLAATGWRAVLPQA